MPRSSMIDYANAVRLRYMKASKSEKGAILSEFCQTTDLHRKSAIRLLRRAPEPRLERRGRPRTYGAEVARALEVVWGAEDYACSKRLAPFLREVVPILEAHGVLHLSASVREDLISLSPSSIDRLLKPVRMWRLRHPHSPVRSPTPVRGRIPVRTFGEWKNAPVGSIQVDLVLHCGNSTSGFFLATLVAVDVVTGWTECTPVWGHSQSRVGGAIDRIRRMAPFPVVALHSDNGGEFLNEPLYHYCKSHQIRFTHGRPYKKNDQAYVEQKNWQVVRRIVGYYRWSTKEAYDLLDQLYVSLRLYVNFFQPLSKVVWKERTGAKVRKRYDEARTPYQRLRDAQVVGEETGHTLQKLYPRLNPVHLLGEIDKLVRELQRVAVVDPMTKAIVARKARVLDERLAAEARSAG